MLEVVRSMIRGSWNRERRIPIGCRSGRMSMSGVVDFIGQGVSHSRVLPSMDTCPMERNLFSQVLYKDEGTKWTP